MKEKTRKDKIFKIIAHVSRIITGAVFMFSGFVKGVDPMGTAYKIQDYLVAYNFDFLVPLALSLAILLCAVEFTVGFMLFFNLQTRISAWILFLMMIFFTGLTLYDAIYEPVPDCGCFGDAIKLTNWETFYKNVVLIILAVFVFIHRKKFVGVPHKFVQSLISILVFILFIGFSTYSYKHLPVVDFLEWRVGNKLYNENPKPIEYYVTYQNKETLETKEYLLPDFPYNDSVWVSQWEFVSQRTYDPNDYPGKSLIIQDTLGNIVTNDIIQNPDYQLVITSYNLSDISPKAIQKIQKLEKSHDCDILSIAFLTSQEPDNINEFANENDIFLDYYMSDDIILKTMVRSNPGFMLLKEGVVIKKWSYRDFPNYDELNKKWLNK
ncbi:MAG: BT_3928 family protein [Bacteroidales bacterium]